MAPIAAEPSSSQSHPLSQQERLCAHGCPGACSQGHRHVDLGVLATVDQIRTSHRAISTALISPPRPPKNPNRRRKRHGDRLPLPRQNLAILDLINAHTSA
uniref:Uncharacterized protein n=1 Tax=Oryza nivara TaxID=4536 RepID=A0A0E0HCT4_ORYNI